MMLKEKNKTGETLRSGTSGLIESMNSGIERRVAEINNAADEEIRKMEDSARAEISEFSSAQERKSDEHIENEKIKIVNRSFIEKKKQSLDIIDSFMEKIIEEALETLPGSDGYYDFLIGVILEPLKEIRGSSVTVKVSERDLIYSERILNAIRESGFSFKADIKRDELITTGGAVIVDDENGVIYNNSIERIVFRKTDVIRKTIFGLLDEYRKEKMTG